MTPAVADPLAVAGVAESALPPAAAAALPAQTPHAPWATRLRAVAWVHRALFAAPR